MSTTMRTARSLRIEDTVRELCPVIEAELLVYAPRAPSEYELRRELVGCLLGSQVSNETAVKWTDAIELAGLLADEWWSAPVCEQFASEVYGLLAGERQDMTITGRYRFFRLRADQLRRSRDELAKTPLTVRLSWHSAAKDVRSSLVAALPGIGPKQASMLMRNAGISQELAILDRHVLEYMKIVGLVEYHQPAIGTMREYERLEVLLGDYASLLGCSLGSIDWAIWITMRAAREVEL